MIKLNVKLHGFITMYDKLVCYYVINMNSAVYNMSTYFRIIILIENFLLFLIFLFKDFLYISTIQKPMRKKVSEIQLIIEEILSKTIGIQLIDKFISIENCQSKSPYKIIE